MGVKRGRDKEEDHDGSESEEEIQELSVDEDEEDMPVEEIYEKKSQLQHILDRPDSYIGSIEPSTQTLFIFDENSGKMVERKLTFIPGLYKIFDEILVNAADNSVRDANMDKIKVTISKEEKKIVVYNNGKGVPIQMHQKEKMYVPSLIFGELLTGSNFKDDKNKVTGGRNGYGAKLANIFSTKFIVETCDGEQSFKQVWKNNMRESEEPVIKKAKKNEKSFTQVTFYPDFSKFNISSFEDDDTITLLTKRVYDIAGTTQPGVIVHLNGKRVPVKKFDDYIKLYKEEKKDIIFQDFGDRWGIGVASSDGNMQQVSFVNSVWTMDGGKHVSYIVDQIVKYLSEKLKKKNKSVPLKPQHIKNHLFIFVNCLIINPSFSSQTKEKLTTQIPKFGSKCKLDEEFLKKIAKSPIVDRILDFAKEKESSELKKKSGTKKQRLTGIAKLDDANDAGTRYSEKCTLILTEGDSAKALAVSGLSVIGRDRYGVFPLKGKLLNVRDATFSRIQKNEEISTITKVVGLKHGETYSGENLKSLRYGCIMIMADQDADGSHIKGLILNYIHKFWPSLLSIPGFVKEFITPIIKAVHKKTKKEITFFTIPEYLTWKEQTNTKLWTIKYYKGLGTSTAQEAKKYFSNLRKHQINFKWQQETSERMEIIFGKGKGREDKRKDWINSTDKHGFVDHSKGNVTYTDFFDKEYIHFAIESNQRAIPSVMDGLKPAQRKILYSCFKRNLTKEIKVAQLAGYVAEHSAYHHGEAALADTIVGMAQDFVGSNNINYLFPSGQFGTRLQNGDDKASARYIFTRLSEITRYVFREEDDPVLKYLDDDGQMIEPEWYVPIFPTVLLNGVSGMGVGYSTTIPSFNPLDLVTNIRKMIKGEEIEEIHPYYRGFTGSIEFDVENKKNARYKTQGIVEKIDDTTVTITELPVLMSVQEFKEFLMKLMEGDKIKDFRENHTDTEVLFTVIFSEAQMQSAESQGFISFFKLHSYIPMTNMTAFTSDLKILKFSNVSEIFKQFFPVRLNFYQLRKDYLVDKLQKEFDILDNKVRFILAVVNEEIVIRKKKRADILKELVTKGFKSFPKDTTKKKLNNQEEEDDDDDNEDISELNDSNLEQMASGYNYLLSMPLWSLTLERVKNLEKQKKDKFDQLETLKKTEITELWIRDLDAFEEKYHQLLEVKEKSTKKPKAILAQSANGRRKPAQKKKAPKKKSSEDSDTNSEEDVKPKKTKASPKKKTVRSKNAIKKESDSENDLIEEKPKVLKIKKQNSSDQEEELEIESTKPLASAKSTKRPPAKRRKTEKKENNNAKITQFFQFSKKKQRESDDDDDDDDDDHDSNNHAKQEDNSDQQSEEEKVDLLTISSDDESPKEKNKKTVASKKKKPPTRSVSKSTKPNTQGSKRGGKKKNDDLEDFITDDDDEEGAAVSDVAYEDDDMDESSSDHEEPNTDVSIITDVSIMTDDTNDEDYTED